jgi:hypothetical protein
MIKGFADKETEKLWNRERSKAVPANLQRGALRELTQLNNAEDLNDLRIPPATSWRSSPVRGRGSTRSGSTSNTGCASSGKMATPTT